MNNLTLDFTETVAPQSTETRWDSAIANALNEAFSTNAQDRMMRDYRPYYPLMPLPIDCPVSNSRDLDEYEWNKTILRYGRAFADKSYELCFRLLDILKSLHKALTHSITRKNQYTSGHYDAAYCILDAIYNREYDLEKAAPPTKSHWITNEQKQPIQWRAA